MMMELNDRLLILGGSLMAGFSLAFLMPDVNPMRSSRLEAKLPAQLGDWEGMKIPITERELAVLADDTIFERRTYQQTINVSLPPIQASVVFSGKDMNNSIHRPEVCLRTQGWNFVHERYVTVHEVIFGGKPLVVREIICNKSRRNPETGKPIVLPNGKIFIDWQILHYTFIGSESVTPSHYGRVFIDIKDRALWGFDQQWAYATFSSLIPGKYEDQGVDLGSLTPLSIEQTSAHLTKFMQELFPLVFKKTTAPDPLPALPP
ncbi:MAG: hypothetical protein RLZZ245_1828 [Verrucomicrobiota bacterium]|jgi:hypothetical protein